MFPFRGGRSAFPLLLALLALGLPACGESPLAPAPPADRVTRGVTFVDWSAGGYGGARARASLDRLAATGARDLVVVVTAYQDDARALRIRADDPRTASPAAVRAALRRAADDHGLRLALKLHVDLDDGAWRGTLDPPDPAAWFAAYTGFVAAWARLAREEGVERFILGTELSATLDHEARWRAVAAAARAEFDGELGYAASWDHAHLVPFWDAVDLTGVDFYAPVASTLDPSPGDIRDAWDDWLPGLRSLAVATGRPVVFTEIGYRSADGAGLHPYVFGDQRPVDLAEQADLYRAALQVAAEHDWIEGLYLWNWLASGDGGPDDTDYTPLGKPAEEVLRTAWAPL